VVNSWFCQHHLDLIKRTLKASAGLGSSGIGTVEIRDFLVNLKDVGSSPYAFAAYIAVVAAWVYTSIARHRLGKIGQLLKDLPREDRTRVILKEYSTLPRSGLSAEQWIKSRQHLLLFLAFLSLMLCLTIIVVIALGSPSRPNSRSDQADSSAMMGILQGQSQRILELERDVKELTRQAADLKVQLASIGQNGATPRAVALMQDVQRQLPFVDLQSEAILEDPTLTLEDKLTLTRMMLIQKLDDDIAEQTRRVNALQNSSSTGHSIDVETMKLKRLIDKRSQTFDMLRQIIDKYNETAKGIIDSMR
jgi:hypothetical protein